MEKVYKVQSYLVKFDLGPVDVNIRVYHEDESELSRNEILAEAFGYAEEAGIELAKRELYEIETLIKKEDTNLKLQETLHRYYCNPATYFCSETHTTFETWTEFKEYRFGTQEIFENFCTKHDDYMQFLDTSLCIRFDIEPYEETIDGKDVEFFSLHLFFVQQRKGFFTSTYIQTITQEDMPEIEKYLACNWRYLKEQWKEIAEREPSEEGAKSMKLVCDCGNDMRFDSIDKETGKPYDSGDPFTGEGQYVTKDFHKFEFWAGHDVAGMKCNTCGTDIWFYT